MYSYGLKARPFSSDYTLSETDWSTLVTPLKVAEHMSNVFKGVTLHDSMTRHGILVTNTQLSEEEVLKHELVDIQAEIDSPWNRVLKVIDYLVKKNATEKYLTKAFYMQIEMDEDAFIDVLCQRGYECEYELLKERKTLANA